MDYARATTVKFAKAEEETHPAITHPASCLCCGHVGEHAVWKIGEPSTYVCVICKRAADAARNTSTALTNDEIMEAFHEAFPGHDFFQESLDFGRAVERRVMVKRPDCGDKGFHCGDPDCDACIPHVAGVDAAGKTVDGGM